ncbi:MULTISPECIES: cystathionine beta-lyase [Anoxybacillus]|uniref:cysteine-S-conjugate beta-lyase n=1 Tax=Anoxybacillus flavithermus TaxID=33934 RepID=A0A178TPM5_9BACL|nr:cystathionine beta-lyase [Anoxybacillus flavithermus]ASA96523.1 cystathionine gamma-synthase [Anoxybacillus flavithermus]ELK21288.1 cystathionine beta-lyase MetC [Anoxybacillus flavithermus TNO-09.006]MBE2905293.1 cystathionine beta-lyase [Anoxybacillus flavithermus]MBE2909018.1 cystathionine beta-lyase [Anoxybacillus flavithermus]MBE2911089.1 cystathionine beta-lyase [Anoxybacillus flavithermus]
MDLQTQLVHNKWRIDAQTGAVSVPIHHASTFHQFDFDTFGKYDYSRSGNPTREALEETIAELEGGVSGFAFASGMAAISTAFLLLSKGDHVLITDDVYGGTYRIITDVLSRFGIEHTFVDMTDLDAVARHIRPNTKVIYMETPSNPLLKITDIRGVVKLAKAHGCLTFLDNTFATPLLQRPLDLGVDVVLHSATKFLAGHSDVVAGLAVVKDERLAKQLRKLQYSFGAVLGVQDAWLVLRGLKTLHVRLDYASRSALQLAQFLHHHPKVAHVYYPGLSFHEGHDIHRDQARGFGAVLSFELEDEQAVRTFVKHARIPVFAVSLGAVESILSYPAKMSHAAMPKAERHRRGITDGLLRLSVGLEATDDLLADVEQALSYV